MTQKEINKEQIKKQAKEIMDNFVNAMGNIEVEENFTLKREKSYRNDGNGQPLDENFKQRFLKNAPKTKGDAILANKGEWTKNGN